MKIKYGWLERVAYGTFQRRRCFLRRRYTQSDLSISEEGKICERILFVSRNSCDDNKENIWRWMHTTAQYSTCQTKYLSMFIYSAVLITPKFIHGVDLKSVVPILILYIFIGYQKFMEYDCDDIIKLKELGCGIWGPRPWYRRESLPDTTHMFLGDFT